MPREAVISSMGPAFEMGSLREEMRKLPCLCLVVAVARAEGVGKGSFGEVMWFILAVVTDFSSGL